MKELTETASLSAFRNKFETSRSFDLEDDMEFCPGLLTESDVSNTGGAIECHPKSDTLSRSWSPSPVLLNALL